MKFVKGFDCIDFTDWVIFKMLIKIYGEDTLIKVLNLIKSAGGIKNIHTVN